MIYLFEATYENMITFERVVRTINVDIRLAENEREVFLQAMNIAYDMKGNNETIDKLECIGC